MSATANLEAVANQGQFHCRIPPSQPFTTKGHAPGIKVGKDALPEFNTQKLPPGTAPQDRTFYPNPIYEIPSQANNLDVPDEARTSAENTLHAATSADVHMSYGHLYTGQSSRELHGNGNPRGVRPKQGLAAVGADPGDTYRARALDKDAEKGTRGYGGTNRDDWITAAEERHAVGDEEYANERERRPDPTHAAKKVAGTMTGKKQVEV